MVHFSLTTHTAERVRTEKLSVVCVPTSFQVHVCVCVCVCIFAHNCVFISLLFFVFYITPFVIGEQSKPNLVIQCAGFFWYNNYGQRHTAISNLAINAHNFAHVLQCQRHCKTAVVYTAYSEPKMHCILLVLNFTSILGETAHHPAWTAAQ